MILSTLMLVASCDPQSSHQGDSLDSDSSQKQEELEKVEGLALKDGAVYNGTINSDGKLEGEGTITYANKDTLKGKFSKGNTDGEMTYVYYDTSDKFVGTGKLDENYKFVFDYGTYSYSKNKRTYTGHFKDNLFEDDDATFSFGTGTFYKGPFKAGSNVGLIGTMYYPPYTMKGEGVWWIKGEMISLGKIKGQTYVEGFIRFGDRSTYEGGIYYDGNNGYYRYGEGVQDFSACNFSADTVGGPTNQYLYKYVGNFNYRISQWIYGNGVMYFSDVNQQPTGYIPGFWTSTKLLKNYQGDESGITLLDGYSTSMKCDYHPMQSRVDDYVSKYGSKESEIVFAGDSYIDMWQSSYGITSYEEDMKSYDSTNVGIGGTIAEEWYYMCDSLVTPYAKNKVVIHLGFNDLHLGATPSEALASMQKFIAKVRQTKPSLQFYLLSVEPSPAFASYLSVEKQLNAMFKNLADNDDKITFINTASLFMNGENTISDLSSYFISDYVHMNKKGYDKWVQMIKSYIDA